jgi:hypothetical protein
VALIASVVLENLLSMLGVSGGSIAGFGTSRSVLRGQRRSDRQYKQEPHENIS